MKFMSLVLFTVAVAALTGCTRIKVSSECDPAYRFSRIETYQWIEAPDATIAQNATSLDPDLQKALNNELAAQGWTQVLDPANATVQIASYLKLATHQEAAGRIPDSESEFSGGLVFERNKREWTYEQRDPDQVAYTTETGTLHIMMNDTETGKSIWHASAQATIDRSLTPEKQDELLRRIAHTLFEKLP